jgi:DNA-binding SARP family transcriptional activator
MAEGVIRVRLLGPLEVSVAGRLLSVPNGRPAAVLALLALAGGRPVGIDALADGVWGDRPPRFARASLATLVTRLRQALGAAAIRTVPAGYALAAGESDVDALEFRALLRAAGTAAPPAAVRLLDRALELWQGEPLAGLPGVALAEHAAALAEERVSAVLARARLDLAAGRAAAAVPPLRDLALRHPLRQPVWRDLIAALAGAGRGAEALAAYEDVRVRLRDQLGVEPAADLRALHQELLAGTVPAGTVPAGTVPAGDGQPAQPRRVVPAQLPGEVAGFTGRAVEVAQLDALLRPGRPGGVGVVAVTGAPGVGKTALAVHWAHRVAGRYPDGVLYVNLNGFALAAPVPPIEALGRFLRTLGVAPDAVPSDVDEAAGLYRSLLAGARMLVVLDNAGSADQVRPLLPGVPSAALVTSRDRLSGLVALDGASRLELPVLRADDAVTLLSRLVGATTGQSSTDPAGVAELARQCGYLPLALRIAAANLADDPHQTIAHYTADLASRRLAALQVDGDDQAAVRAAFDRSYAALPPTARRLFRLLGLLPGSDVDPPAAAALAGADADPAVLVAAHLVEEDAGRYGMHDLLRMYAAERAEAEEGGGDRAAALDRLYTYYLSRAGAAVGLLFPTTARLPLPPGVDPKPFDTGEAALAWLDTERLNLVAAVRAAAEHGPRPAAWRLADALRMYFFLRMHATDWETVAAAGLAAAGADGAADGIAAAHLSLAMLRGRQGHLDRAIEHFSAAVRHAQAAGWLDAEGSALINLGQSYANTGRPQPAADCFRRALAIQRRTGNLGGQAAALCCLAELAMAQGWPVLAERHNRDGLARYQEAGSAVGEAVALSERGAIMHALGRLDTAVDLLAESLRRCRAVGNRPSEAETLYLLAAVLRDRGDLDAAAARAAEALDLAERLEHRSLRCDALREIAAIAVRRGEYAAAAGHCEQALALAREVANRHQQATVLCGLSAARLGLGRPDEAATDADAAARIARECGYRMVEAAALTARAAADLARSDVDGAAERAARAAALCEAAGYRLGRARALALLADCRDPTAAEG